MGCLDPDCAPDFATLGEPCDGDDTDLCPNGVLTCTPDGAGVSCASESVESIAEACDGADADCDGLVGCQDPDCAAAFADLGEPCDGPDPDQCANGLWACAPDGAALECSPESVEAIEEICDGEDNDCDGETDESPDCAPPNPADDGPNNAPDSGPAADVGSDDLGVPAPPTPSEGCSAHGRPSPARHIPQLLLLLLSCAVLAVRRRDS